MADGKWIDGLRPEMSQTKAARQVLSVRLELVRDWLPARSMTLIATRRMCINCA